jgi:hypothetical protein
VIIPPGNREVRLAPPLAEWPKRMEANRRLLEASPWADLRRLARSELERAWGVPSGEPLLMTGHQPEFVHPGIWARFLLLDLLAQRWGWKGAAFSVDFDLADGLAVEVPFLCASELLRRKVRLSLEGGGTFESLAAPSPEAWKHFLTEIDGDLDCQAGARAQHAFRRVFDFTPPANVAFPSFLISLRRFWEGGPQYPEFTFSSLTRMESFQQFALSLISNARPFAETLNAALAAWRMRHRARSTAVPFPDLATSGGKVELPFWWIEGGQRLPLFLRDDHLEAGSRILGPTGGMLHEGAIRPRAVTLTLYLRLAMADLFLHGAGGADYEEVTDEVILKYFGFQPPAYASASLTLFLPGLEIPLNQWKRFLRDLEQRPEHYLARLQREALAECIKEKAALLEAGKLDRAGYRHLQELNQRLRQPLRAQIISLERRVAWAEEAHKVSAFRGYPFLFYQAEEVRSLLERVDAG